MTNIDIDCYGRCSLTIAHALTGSSIFASIFLIKVGGREIQVSKIRTYNHKLMAEHLVVGKDIPLGKYLLGAAYHLMHQVAAQLLKNEPVHTISGPWWLIQLWLNLYMHKIVRHDLKNLSFHSSNFDEEYRGEEGRTRQCMSYGEAASTITIAVDVGYLFKKFY